MADVATHAELMRSGETVRAAPFDAISFPLDHLFPFDAPPSPEA